METPLSTGTIVRTSQGPSLVAFLNPFAAVANLWRHRDLIWQLAKLDIVGRYKAARLGLLWSILTPLFLLAVYTFAFAVVFKARWGDNPNESRAEFALTMFCGLLLYNLFAEVVLRAPGMVVGYPNYVKKVVFPLEVFIVSGLLSALVNMLIGYGVWFTGWTLLNRALPHATIALFPLILLPVCLASAGVAWFLASVGVFVRDVGHAVGIAIQVLFFATPIFYSIDRVPEPYRAILQLNPLAHALEDARRILMWGETPNWMWWGVTVAASGALALFGYAFFMKSKRAFADVI